MMVKPSLGAAQASGPSVSVGRVLGIAFATLGRRFVPLVGAALVLHALATIFNAGAVVALTFLPMPAMPSYLLIAFPYTGQFLALGVFAGFAAAILAAEQYGAPVSWGAAARIALRRFPAVFGVILITVGGIVAIILVALLVYEALGLNRGPSFGFMAFACVFVGQTMFVAAAAATLEELPPLAAARRSHGLTNHQFWRMLVLTALTGVIAIGPALFFVAGHVMNALAGNAESQSLGGALLADLGSSVIGQLALGLLPAAAFVELRRLRDDKTADPVAGVFD